MGRLLIFLGLILVVGGIAATVIGFSSGFMGSLGGVVDSAVNLDERAAELCESGEQLETDEGASSYTPGQGSGRNVFYYCVNDADERRDITSEVYEGFIGQTFDSISNMIPGVGAGLLGGCAIPIGVVFIVIGAIVGRRHSPGMMTVNGRPVVTVRSNLGQSMPAGGGVDWVARLKQLDDARSKGLISQEEYDKLRQQILDSMK